MHVYSWNTVFFCLEILGNFFRKLGICPWTTIGEWRPHCWFHGAADLHCGLTVWSSHWGIDVINVGKYIKTVQNAFVSFMVVFFIPVTFSSSWSESVYQIRYYSISSTIFAYKYVKLPSFSHVTPIDIYYRNKNVRTRFYSQNKNKKRLLQLCIGL